MKIQLALFGSLALASSLAHVAVQAAPRENTAWRSTMWRGERAYELVTAHWRAVISVERGRLVHFGPVAGDNLLFETPSRANPFSWGGHRVWLGPQGLWGWPPPEAWERSAAESVRVIGGRLELTMPAAGDGYPTLTRIYEPAGARLACRVAVAGGRRSVQVIQILQMPADTTVELTRAPSSRWPRGYFRVGGAVGPVLDRDLPRPAGVEETTTGVRFAYTGRSDKLAFPPQTLVATCGAQRLLLAFGESRGREVAAPDEGFYTQVYIGDPASPVVEIEQLSPQWAAGEAAEFSMYVGLNGAD